MTVFMLNRVDFWARYLQGIRLIAMSLKRLRSVLFVTSLLILVACQSEWGSKDESVIGVTPKPLAGAKPTLTDIPTATPIIPTATPLPATPTSRPPATPTVIIDDLAISEEQVRLFPVPFIISGDRVTFQVLPDVPKRITVTDVDVDIYVNDELISTGKLDSRNWAGQAEGIFEWVWDTQGHMGQHTIRVVLDGKDLIVEGDANTENNEISFDVDIGKVTDRPLEERDAKWITAETDCCKVTILTRTTAYRDLPELLDEVEYAVAEAAIKLQEEPQQKIDVFFIDRTIGQGGFAGSEMTATYVDRAYATGNLHELLVHEAVHVIDRQFAPQRIKFLAEGIAVWVSGGHYKPEDLDQRAAALLAIEEYIPLADLVNDFYPAQHEIGYLQAGAFVKYLVDQFGYPTFREFYADTKSGEGQSDAEALDLNLQTYYDYSLAEMEAEWKAHLRSLTIEEVEIADLETSIRYYEVMRQYQKLYDPTAHFLNAWLPSPLAVQAEGNPADITRHPQNTINITLELILHSAETALMEQEFMRANVLLDSVERILAEDGAFNDPLSSAYMDIVQVATNFGYEVQNIDLQGDNATALVTTASGFYLQNLDFERRRGDWILLR